MDTLFSQMSFLRLYTNQLKIKLSHKKCRASLKQLTKQGQGVLPSWYKTWQKKIILSLHTPTRAQRCSQLEMKVRTSETKCRKPLFTYLHSNSLIYKCGNLAHPYISNKKQGLFYHSCISSSETSRLSLHNEIKLLSFLMAQRKKEWETSKNKDSWKILNF